MSQHVIVSKHNKTVSNKAVERIAKLPALDKSSKIRTLSESEKLKTSSVKKTFVIHKYKENMNDLLYDDIHGIKRNSFKGWEVVRGGQVRPHNLHPYFCIKMPATGLFFQKHHTLHMLSMREHINSLHPDNLVISR